MGKPWYRWMRLSLRATMLAILVIGVWLGFTVNRARQQRAAAEAVAKHGGWTHYDHEYVNGKYVPQRQPWGPVWLRRSLGDEYFQKISLVSFVYDNSTGKRYDNKSAEKCDDVLELLASQHSLRTLLMKGPQATDKGLAFLKNQPNLEELYIWDSTEISDEGLEDIRGLVKLKKLHLDKSKITDRGFLALAGLTEMEHLVLQSHSFSDRGFSAVAGMKNLKWLCVGGSKDRLSLISDESLSLIKNMTNLSSINLSYSRITDKGLVHLQGLTKLEILDLDGCKVGDGGLKCFAGLVNLKWLILNDSSVSDAGLGFLLGLPKLQLLQLSGSKVSANAKQQLKDKLPSLRIN
jgi:Leucine-rich repeat (LRR) protein